MTTTALFPRCLLRWLLVFACLAGVSASLASDAAAQARRRRPLLAGARSPLAAARAQDRARVERPRAKRERVVTLSAAALDPRTAPDGASDLDLQLFADRRLAVRLDRIDRRSNASFVWHGRVIGRTGWATFASNDGVVAGTIFTDDAAYEVAYAGEGLYEVRELDPLAFPTDDPADQVPVVPPADEPTPVAPADTAAQIDVLVLWTPAARSAAGGTSAIQSTVDLAVASANTAYGNSGITTRLRLVHRAEVTYTESSISTDLTRLQATTDGHLDTIHALRDQYGADLVSLVGSGYTSSGACGIGYLMQSPSTTYASYGFNVVDVSCAAGNLSLAHELGHNEGMHHDAANAMGVGAFPYSYGYQDPAGNFRTVMAYACGYGAGCPRVPYFSSPTHSYNAVPVGTATADNAQTLNNTAAYVANFRQEVIGACSYSLSPSTISAAASASSPSVTMTAGEGCSWTAQSGAAWLTVTTNGAGSGNATMTLSVAANTGSARNTTLTAAGQSVTVSQAAATTGTQPTITAPSGTVAVASAEDFAVNVLHDRWDMNDRWDLGWFLHSADQPAANLTSPVFSNGEFTATTATTDPSVWLLETGLQGAAALTGRTGAIYSIETAKYRRLNLRMCLTGSGATSEAQTSSAQLYWSRNTIYTDNSTPNSFAVYGGCTIYSLDLPSWSVGRMPSVPGLQQYAWTDTIRALRLDPTARSGQTVRIDWASLTATSDAATTRTFTWTGTAPVDLFLDNDNNAANGNLGLVWKDGTPALGVTGGSYTFQVGGLPPGDYYIAARLSGASSYVYSPGLYRVAARPTITVLSPSDEGSADDFATAQLGDPWDMAQATDVDRTSGVNGFSQTTLTLERTQGTTVPTQPVVRGSAVAGADDPVVWPLWSGTGGRGQHHRIDTSRYRILTLEMGLSGARNINNGSIARIIWKRADESHENVSEDVVVNHRQGVNSLDRIIVDMADRTALPLEAGSGSPSHSGWTGMVDSFRIDPHEFTDARQFWIKRVKLAALERASGSYTIRWRLAGADAGTRVRLYRDTNATGFNGTEIATNLTYNNEADGSGSYVWNLSGVPAGSHHVYVVATTSGGQVLSQAYARWPLTVGPAAPNQLAVHVDRPSLRFAGARNGAQKTGAQTVGVTFSGGITNWTATPTSSCNFIDVTGGSGTGAGSFTVSIQNRTNFPNTATLTCTVRIDATGAINTPQYVNVELRLRPTGTAPFGAIGSPAESSTVSGAFALSGWALDDLEVSEVTIWRDPVPGEAPGPNGRIYVGVAPTLEDARPDVAAVYPAYPFAYRAGWGVLVLSNQLPGGGNGSFRFHVYASDPDGHSTLLGTRRVTAQNASSVLPFGTLDTPAPGSTVSGTVRVWGWALTPSPAFIPEDGSTIRVYVDGIMVGHPSYDLYRDDIARAFPGYANTNGAVGYYMLDTTTLENGVHTIAWSVTDSAGHSQGIGSRHFRVRN